MMIDDYRERKLIGSKILTVIGNLASLFQENFKIFKQCLGEKFHPSLILELYRFYNYDYYYNSYIIK